jgi:hypothetical protein
MSSKVVKKSNFCSLVFFLAFLAMLFTSSSAQTCNVGQEWITSTCVDCPEGKYQENNGVSTAIRCKFCAAGKKFNTKKVLCLDCGSGKYQNQNTVAPAVCKTCGAGQYASAKENNCGACGTGKFQELTASIEYTCKFCVAGKKFNTKALACIECGSGKYQ